jgi:ubiquitin C-terminal hydrolase
VTQRTQLKFCGENVALFFKRGFYSKETGNNSKLDTQIVIQESLETVDSTLELFAIIYQLGEFEGGHYLCHIKRGNQWYECDDSKITPLDGPDLESGNITACFYAASVD